MLVPMSCMVQPYVPHMELATHFHLKTLFLMLARDPPLSRASWHRTLTRVCMLELSSAAWADQIGLPHSSSLGSSEDFLYPAGSALCQGYHSMEPILDYDLRPCMWERPSAAWAGLAPEGRPAAAAAAAIAA